MKKCFFFPKVRHFFTAKMVPKQDRIEVIFKLAKKEDWCLDTISELLFFVDQSYLLERISIFFKEEIIKISILSIILDCHIEIEFLCNAFLRCFFYG